MPRRLRRLLVMAGVAAGLAIWRNRMLAANAASYRQTPGGPAKQPTGNRLLRGTVKVTHR